jgi:hypothetical protein
MKLKIKDGSIMTELYKSNCLVCGEELVYIDQSQKMECFYCGQFHDSNASCGAGHFICDTCHSLPSTELIKQFCINTELLDPIEMAKILMRDERIKMHGPEHHFLVPAVLLAAYFNTIGKKEAKSEKIEQARKRAQNVLGGFCGFYGTCGAAVGTGMFISLVTGATPLSKDEWMLSNLMTSRSLKQIAELGGPRCCKRDTFLAINAAVFFLVENMNVQIKSKQKIVCEFSQFNQECKETDCPFYQPKTT